MEIITLKDIMDLFEIKKSNNTLIIAIFDSFSMMVIFMENNQIIDGNGSEIKPNMVEKPVEAEKKRKYRHKCDQLHCKREGVLKVRRWKFTFYFCEYHEIYAKLLGGTPYLNEKIDQSDFNDYLEHYCTIRPRKTRRGLIRW